MPSGAAWSPNPWAARTAYSMAALALGLGLAGQQLIAFGRLPAAGGSFEPGDEHRLEWLEQRRASWALEDQPLAEPEPTSDDPAPDSTAGETDGEALQSVAPTE